MKIRVKEIDVVTAWNEAEEILTSLNELTDEELVECRDSLKQRAFKILNFLGDYVDEDNINL